MTKHTKYFILICFTLILGSCGVSQKNLKKINYENNKKELIRLAVEDFLTYNNEFFEYQKEYRIEKICVRKTLGLASGMFDFGIPQKTIAIPLKRENLPNNFKSFKYRLFSDNQIERLEKNLESFQYIYLEYLYFTEVKATLNVRLLNIINGQQKSEDVEYKFVKENNKWKITSAKKTV
jgi:hypothetical protein